MSNSIRIARKIIAENIYCTIATSSKDGVPWISPVRFHLDDKYTIYWTSEKDAEHSKLIKENPRVAIVIFDSRVPEGKGNGVYITARATEVTEAELPHALEVMYKERATKRTHTDFQGDSPRRIYQAVPQKIWILQEPIEIKGHLVDRRIEVDLNEI